jgi:hypothetical protein
VETRFIPASSDPSCLFLPFQGPDKKIGLVWVLEGYTQGFPEKTPKGLIEFCAQISIFHHAPHFDDLPSDIIFDPIEIRLPESKITFPGRVSPAM